MLFNERGLAAVSQRNITDQMEISPGNLTYHFSKKEDMVSALYFRLVAQFSALFQELEGAKISIMTLVHFSEAMFELMYSYRFFFIDFAYLMRTYPKIKNHYQELLLKRRQQFVFIAQSLQQSGFIREEELDAEYEKLFDRMRLNTDFFLLTVSEGLNPTVLKKEFIVQVFYLIYPYLTSFGKKKIDWSRFD